MPYQERDADMRFLKKFWEKCGEERFTAELLTFGCTLITCYNFVFMDNPLELNGLLFLLNAAMIISLIMEDSDYA